MDPHLMKTRISRIFRSSLVSCRSKNVSDDIIQNPVFMPHTQSSRHFNYDAVQQYEYSNDHHHDPAHRHRRKVSDRGVTYVVSGDTDDGRVCPPTSPTSTPLPKNNKKKKEKEKKKKKKANAKTKKKERSLYSLIMSSSDDECENSPLSSGWFSSEGGEAEKSSSCFVSTSTTSDSSGQYYTRRRRKKKKKKKKNKKKDSHTNTSISTSTSTSGGRVGMRVIRAPSDDDEDDDDCKGGGVKESVAVVKRSSDPKSDFRRSMVEMIVEKQLFGAKDLEELLHCFLYLNPPYHHCVIVEVFWEIWEALFVV